MRFICDTMLGSLAKHLRMLGLDTLYYRSISVPLLLRTASDEQRILLTRRSLFLKQPTGVLSCFITKNDLSSQLEQVMRHFSIARSDLKPLSLCLLCNTALQERNKDAIADMVPEYVYATVTTFAQCPACSRIYWQGTHYAKMSSYISDLLTRKS